MSLSRDDRSRRGRPGRRVRRPLRAEALEDRWLLAVTLTGQFIAATEGMPFNGLVATFTSNDPAPQSAANYRATITFDDGTSIAGTVTAAANGGVFDVTTAAPHTFAEEGSFPFGVTVFDAVDATSASVTDTALVDDAPLSAQGTTMTGVPGAALTGIVATFSDADPNGMASDYTAVIDWGDNTPPTAGVIGSTDRAFTVAGTHTYAVQGHYAIGVTIMDRGPRAAVVGSQAIVTPAPPQLQPGGANVTATAGTPLLNVPVAKFLGDTVADDYQAVINWGDGTPPSVGKVVPGTPGGNSYSVLGDHTFVAPGVYDGTITVNAVNGASATIPLTSTAFAPALSPATLSVTEDQPLNNADLGTLAAPAGAPAIAPNFYTATVDFGDGTAPAPGSVSPTGMVIASHTYAESGDYNIRITIGTPGDPDVASTTIAQAVKDVPINLTGFLDPSSDTGASDSDLITKDNTPTFFGNSEPGSVVDLFAVAAGANAPPSLIGGGVTDAAGIWRITTVPLPDADYTIVASAVDRNGKTMAQAQLAPSNGSGPLVIDTVGPKVTAVIFDRTTGRVGVAFQDDHSGMDQTSLIDGANYSLTGASLVGANRKGPFLITEIVAPPPTSPTAAQPVTLAINGGRSIRGGRFVLTVRSGGIRDVAGNALDGEFYGFFPSGNNQPGGDLVAELDAIHNVIFSPLPIQNGFATPLNPPGTPGSAFNTGQSSSSGLTAAQRRAVQQAQRRATQQAALARRQALKQAARAQRKAAAQATQHNTAQAAAIHDLALAQVQVSKTRGLTHAAGGRRR
jgi:hypothetical protein